VIEEDARVIRHERGAEPAVGDLAGELEPARREGGEIDRNVGARLRRRTQRLALAARQRQLVDLALEGHALAAGGAADDLDDLAQPRERAIEAQPVPALDHLRALTPRPRTKRPFDIDARLSASWPPAPACACRPA